MSKNALLKRYKWSRKNDVCEENDTTSRKMSIIDADIDNPERVL